MKVICSNCKKEFNIPDERLPKGRQIAFPCPSCKALIELDLRQSPPAEAPSSGEDQKDLLKGEALKKKILRNVKDLPPMPQTVLKAREIIADPKSDFKDLAELFETDQAIATKILKLANSPYYGMGGKVSSIQRASVILGHKTLGEIIAMGGASSILGKRLDGYGLDAGALWKHSLAVAFGSRIIAQKIDPSLLNDAFTSGLIHDTGKMILDKYITERWDKFEAFMADSNESFLSAEKAILEFDHAEAAFEVCKEWNIPKTLTIAIRYHHFPSRSHESILAYIVHVADAIAMMTGLGLGVDGAFYKMDNNAMEFLGLKEDAINDIMVEVLNAAQKISI
jgi:HD-like signal output (HDOD) protein/DNA-directed RNA polymerase subunit RPC12/RpoP